MTVDVNYDIVELAITIKSLGKELGGLNVQAMCPTELQAAALTWIVEDTPTTPENSVEYELDKSVLLWSGTSPTIYEVVLLGAAGCMGRFQRLIGSQGEESC